MATRRQKALLALLGASLAGLLGAYARKGQAEVHGVQPWRILIGITYQPGSGIPCKGQCMCVDICASCVFPLRKPSEIGEPSSWLPVVAQQLDRQRQETNIHRFTG